MADWSHEEWQKILNIYANGGLMGFAQRTDTNLNFISSFNLSISALTITQQNFDVYKCWQESYVELTPDISPEQQANYTADIGRLGVTGIIAIICENPIPVIMAVISTLDKNSNKKQAQESKQEQEIKILKNQLYNHYQSIGRSMVEKLMIHLNFTLQNEETRLSETIKTKVDEMVSHLAKIKKRCSECQAQLQNIQKEKIELNQRIKGEVS